MRSRILVLAAVLATAPLGAKAADLVVWWGEGFYPQENEAVREIVAAFEQTSGRKVELTFYEGRAISVELPNTVVREVTYTEPAVKGDTSGKVLKPAKIASGLEVPVPLFVNTGDRIEIDTRTGEYKRRV